MVRPGGIKFGDFQRLSARDHGYLSFEISYPTAQISTIPTSADSRDSFPTRAYLSGWPGDELNPDTIDGIALGKCLSFPLSLIAIQTRPLVTSRLPRAGEGFRCCIRKSLIGTRARLPAKPGPPPLAQLNQSWESPKMLLSTKQSLQKLDARFASGHQN